MWLDVHGAWTASRGCQEADTMGATDAPSQSCSCFTVSELPGLPAALSKLPFSSLFALSPQRMECYVLNVNVWLIPYCKSPLWSWGCRKTMTTQYCDDSKSTATGTSKHKMYKEEVWERMREEASCPAHHKVIISRREIKLRKSFLSIWACCSPSCNYSRDRKRHSSFITDTDKRIRAWKEACPRPLWPRILPPTEVHHLSLWKPHKWARRDSRGTSSVAASQQWLPQILEAPCSHHDSQSLGAPTKKALSQQPIKNGQPDWKKGLTKISWSLGRFIQENTILQISWA